MENYFASQRHNIFRNVAVHHPRPPPAPPPPPRPQQQRQAASEVRDEKPVPAAAAGGAPVARPDHVAAEAVGLPDFHNIYYYMGKMKHAVGSALSILFLI